jgi:hypothetical protein
MKVLFLDHDGVICLANNYGSRFRKNKVIKGGYLNLNKLPIEKRFDDFDKKAIKVLNRIIEKTDCEIVVTSDWRFWATVEEMGVYYEQQGIIKKPIDFSPYINDVEVPTDFKWHPSFDLEQERYWEINNWIATHEIDKWVAVDDLHLGRTVINPSGEDARTWGLDNFVWTPVANEGIKQTGIEEKILKYL